MVFAELQSALNAIWDVRAEPKRGVFCNTALDRLRSFTVALGVGFLLLVSLVISATLSALRDYVNDWMPGIPVVWETLNISTSFVIAAAALRHDLQISAGRRRSAGKMSGSALPSPLVSSPCGKYAISLYLGQTATASAFGAAGSFAVFLIWIYYSALISFFGAEFTQVYARRHGARIVPDEHAVRMGRKTDSI